MIRQRLEHEKGQTLVIGALMLVALVLALGLVVDTGYAYAQRKGMQNAADAAALAGARKLADEAGQIAIYEAIGQYATANGAASFRALYLPSGQAITHSAGQPPSGTSGVRVVAVKEYEPLFMAVLGSESMHVEATAAAVVQEDPGDCLGGYAIWADDRWGGGITGSGSFNVNGQVHSNRGIDFSGNGTLNGLVTYVTTKRLNGNFTLIPSSGNPRQVSASDPPWRYTLADYQPGGRAAVAAQAQGKYHYYSTSQTWSGNQTLSGLYYINGSFTHSANLGGVFTLVARDSITLSGTSTNMEAYCDGLLLFANSGNITRAGSWVWKGVVCAPQGHLTISGSGTYDGCLIAKSLTISGAHYTYDPDYCPPGSHKKTILLAE